MPASPDEQAAPPAATPEPTPAEAPAEVAAVTEDTTDTVVEEEAPLVAPEDVDFKGSEDITEKELEAKYNYDLPIDLSSETEHFDDVSCKDVDGTLVIAVKITNSGDLPWYPYGKANPKGNVKITNRGVTDITPGCDKEEIAVGETMICSGVDMNVVPGENRISIQAPDTTEAKLVMCD